MYEAPDDYFNEDEITENELKMTNQEINEFLAERMFGLVRGKDFGYPVEHDLYWYSADELGDEEGGYICSHCKVLFSENYCKKETCYTEPAPDYISDYRQVLYKLLHNGQDGSILIGTQFGYDVTYIDLYVGRITATSDTLGNTICRVAVKYLQYIEV